MDTMTSRQVSAPTACLIGNLVTLAPFTVEYVTEEYLGWLNNAETMRYSEQRHKRHDRSSCLEFLTGFDQETSHFWAICLPNGRHVGTATAYRDIQNRTADMGILIGEGTLQGRGVGTEAWSLMRDWLFSTGIRKITAGTMSVNAPMRRVFAKTGMVEEGVLKGQLLWNGAEVDLILAGLFSDDWPDRSVDTST